MGEAVDAMLEVALAAAVTVTIMALLYRWLEPNT
jgi:hypothetical protein